MDKVLNRPRAIGYTLSVITECTDASTAATLTCATIGTYIGFVSSGHRRSAFNTKGAKSAHATQKRSTTSMSLTT